MTLNDMQPDYRLSISAALGFFQDTVSSFFADRNIAAFDSIGHGILWVISDHSLHLCGELPMWRDEITVETILSELTPVRMFFDFKLYDRENTCFANGSGTWLPVESGNGRPCSIDHLCEVSADSPDESQAAAHKKVRIPLSGDIVKKESRLLGPGDMDFNRHIGNRSYINHALEMSPITLESEFDLQDIEVKFLRQTYVGDTLTAEFHAVEGENAFLVSETNSAGEEVCRLMVRYRIHDGERRDIRNHVIRGKI